MSRYLEEAAALLRKAAADNEMTATREGWPRSDSEISEGRERIALKFAQLAAIENGVMPVEMAQMILDQARSEAAR